MVVRVSLKLEANWDLFLAKDRMAPEANHFNSSNTRKCNFIGKKETKKPQELVWKFIEKHIKIHKTKIPWPATKEDKWCFLWSRSHSPSHSPIDNCSLFIRHEEDKSQATSYKYRLCSHSLLTAIQTSVYGFKQLHNKRPRYCIQDPQ